MTQPVWFTVTSAKSGSAMQEATLLEGKKCYSFTSDIWGYSCTACYLLCLKPCTVYFTMILLVLEIKSKQVILHYVTQIISTFQFVHYCIYWSNRNFLVKNIKFKKLLPWPGGVKKDQIYRKFNFVFFCIFWWNSLMCLKQGRSGLWSCYFTE